MRRAVPGCDGLNGVFKPSFQNAPAHGPDHELEQSSFEVLAFAYRDQVNVGQAVGPAREGVGVADAPPHALESVVVSTTRRGSDQS